METFIRFGYKVDGYQAKGEIFDCEATFNAFYQKVTAAAELLGIGLSYTTERFTATKTQELGGGQFGNSVPEFKPKPVLGGGRHG